MRGYPWPIRVLLAVLCAGWVLTLAVALVLG